MSDLISRSALIKFFEEHMRTAKDFREIIINIIPTIENQPTAYSVDKVIEELDIARTYNDGLISEVIPFDIVVEILKAGGKNE